MSPNNLQTSSMIVSIVLLCNSTAASAGLFPVTVRADLFFNPTGILASPGEMFLIEATGSVDLAISDGPYITDPNGAILVAPPAGSGAYSFFTSSAGPVGIPPTVGSQKTIITTVQPGHVYGGPYGELVSGFSPTPSPTSFDDFPAGFALIGASGIATAPGTGGYLFLAANDTNNPVDNSGSFSARISIVPEANTLMLLGIGILVMVGSCWRRIAAR